MTYKEIDKWVVEQIHMPPPQLMRAGYPKLFAKAIIKWGQDIAHKFYKIGKSEIPINLTWEDIAKIDAIILDVNNELAVDYSKEISRQKLYEEVLKRYNETKR